MRSDLKVFLYFIEDALVTDKHAAAAIGIQPVPATVEAFANGLGEGRDHERHVRLAVFLPGRQEGILQKLTHAERSAIADQERAVAKNLLVFTRPDGPVANGGGVAAHVDGAAFRKTDDASHSPILKQIPLDFLGRF